MTDNARPEDVAPHSEGDALSGLPEDSRVHLDDIEWPALDWSDTDEAPPPPPGPAVTDADGVDWRPAVPFWLRMPEPEAEPQQAADDEPTDWRPTVPFWLRMPEPEPTPPTPAEPSTPAESDRAQDRSGLDAEPSPEPAPMAAISAEPPVERADEPVAAVPLEAQEPASTPDDLEDDLPDEDLTPLPGTTGEAVFFPPSSSRAAIIRPPASVASPTPATSPDAAEPARPAATTPRSSGAAAAARTPASTSAPGPFSIPGAPYAQYDAPDRDWGPVPPASPWAGPGEPGDQREVPAPTGPPRPAVVKRRWLLRGAVIGSVIGALIISLVVVLAAQGQFNSVDGTLSGAPIGTPDELVTGYLNALAHNDSQQALSFAKLRPTDQRMLTDEVLAASNKAAPLRQIEVRTTELTDYRAQVEAAYLIGEQKVTQSFTVYAVGAEWKLYDVARKVDLALLKTGDLPLVINGVAVPTENVELFPGRYQVATTDDRYQLTNDRFVVSSPGVAPELDTVQLGLSRTGIDKIVAAANTRLQACLGARELQPAGCGFGAVAPRGTKVRLDTMRWKVSKGLNSLKLLRPTLDPDDPRLATADVLIQVTGTAKDTKGGSLGVVDTITTVLADLSADSVQVTLN